MRHKARFLREVTDQLMITLGEPIILTKSVSALLFEGYDDTLLRIAKKLNATTIPYVKFGWFYAVSAKKCSVS